MLTLTKKGHRGHRGLPAQAGFTLIELLVVIAIIGILSSVVLASLNSARQKGRDAKRISDVKQLQLALELAYDSSGGYPAAISLATLVTPGYIAAIPTDPTTNAAYSYESLASDGATACGTAPCAKYVIGAKLENGSNSVLGSDVDTVYSGGPDCTDTGGNNMYCVTP